MARINDNFTLRAPVPVDDRKGWWDDSTREWKPFNDVQHALDTVVYYRYRTLTLPVVDGGDVVEYWFKDGVDDSDFVQKSSAIDLSNYYTKTDLQTSGSAQVHWDNITNIPALSVTWENITGNQSVIGNAGFTNDAEFITIEDIPSQVNADWNAVSGPAFILNKPTIPDLTGYATEQWVLDRGYITGVSWADISGDQSVIGNDGFNNTANFITLADLPELADIAYSGDFDDLLNVPDLATETWVLAQNYITGVTWGDITGSQSVIGNAGFNNTANYITLAQVPAQVQTDWNATTGLASILNKPNLATVATTGDYNDLINQPSIPDLTGYATENWVTSQGYLTSVPWSFNVNNGDLTINGVTNNLDGRWLERSEGVITPGYGITVNGDLATGMGIELDTTVVDNRYLRKDISDSNGAFVLTLGGLVSGDAQFTETVTLGSVATGTTDEVLLYGPGGIIQRKTLTVNGQWGVANAAGTKQFDVALGSNLRFAGTGDTVVSFNSSTNTVTINSVPGQGGGGVITSVFGRTGPAILAETGDYNTSQVNESGNLYFTEPRVLGTDLAGFTVGSNASIAAADTILQAFGKAQGQINARVPISRTVSVSGTSGNISVSGTPTQNLGGNVAWTINLATVGTAGANKTKVTTDEYGRVTGSAALTLGDLPSTVTQTLTHNLNASLGNIGITGGNTIYLSSIVRNVAETGTWDSFATSISSGLKPFASTTGSTGFPSVSSSGFLINRNGVGNVAGSMAFGVSTTESDGNAYFNVGLTSTTWSGWKAIADKDWADGRFVNTYGTQTGIAGDKTWTGVHYFDSSSPNKFSLRSSNNNNAGNFLSFLNDDGSRSGYVGFASTIANAGLILNTDHNGPIRLRPNNTDILNVSSAAEPGIASSIQIGISGSQGVYLRGHKVSSTDYSFVLRGYQASGVQFELNQGGINMALYGSKIKVAGNTILEAGVTTHILNAPTTGGNIYLRPNGDGSTTGQAIFTPTTITLNTLSGTATQMVTVTSAGVLGRAAIPAVGVTSVAAGNGMSFSTITGTGTVTMGTPGSVTLASTNGTSATSHTHDFSPGGTTSQYIRGNGTLATFPSIPQGTVTSVAISSPSAALNVTGGPITSSGTFTMSFAGGTAQYVRGDGSLATFPSIPGAQTLSHNVSGTAGNISISGGNTINLTSLARGTSSVVSWEAYSAKESGFYPFVNTTGSTGYPTGAGAGILFNRNGGTSMSGSFAFYTTSTSATELYYNTGTGTSTWGGWKTIADRDWVSDNYQTTITGGATTITSANLTANRALYSNGSGKVAVSAVTSTELGYLDGVTSNVQTQLNGKAPTTHNHTWSQLSGGSTSLIPGAGASSPRGSINISGSKASYSGINFVDASHSFVVRNSDGLAGIISNTDTWAWYFDGSGVLTVGTVPWARLSGVPAYVPTSRTLHLNQGSGIGITNSTNPVNLTVDRTWTISLANMPANTIKGKISAFGAPEDLTGAQVRSIIGTGTTSQYIRGDGTLATFPSIPSVGNGTLTMSTGAGLSGSDTFTANQSSNTTFTVSLLQATATVRGGIELFSNTVQSVAANAVSATASRTYGVQVNSAGQAVVNVPWTDTEINLVSAGSPSVGAVRYAGTPAGLGGIAGQFYGGTFNPSDSPITRLNLHAAFYAGTLTAMGEIQGRNLELGVSTSGDTDISMNYGFRVLPTIVTAGTKNYTLVDEWPGRTIKCLLRNDTSSNITINVSGVTDYVGEFGNSILPGRTAILEIVCWVNFGTSTTTLQIFQTP